MGKKLRTPVRGNRMKKDRELLEHLDQMRTELGMNDAQLAKALSIPHSRVSEWRSGAGSPSTEVYLKLGSKAEKPEQSIWFWKRAGQDDEKILAAARKIASDRAAEAAPLVEKGDVILVPRFRETTQGREGAGPPVPLPAEFIPNPGATISLLVDAQSSPLLFSPNGLVILDGSVEGAQNLEPLRNDVLLVDYRPIAVRDAEFKHGLYVGRLTFRWQEFPGRSWPEKLGIFSYLEALDGNRRAFLGGWEHPRSNEFRIDMKLATKEQLEEIKQAQKDANERGQAEVRLEKGIVILARVIGRLTGHLK